MSSVLAGRSQEHITALGGQELFLHRTFETHDLCTCAFPEPVKLPEKVCLPSMPSIYKLAFLVQLNRETKGGTCGKFFSMNITGAGIWVLYGIIKWFKNLWRWLQSAFLLLPILYVRGNEWDCYAHPRFIIQEVGSLGRVEDQWVISLLKGIFFSFLHYI